MSTVLGSLQGNNLVYISNSRIKPLNVAFAQLGAQFEGRFALNKQTLNFFFNIEVSLDCAGTMESRNNLFDDMGPHAE